MKKVLLRLGIVGSIALGAGLGGWALLAQAAAVSVSLGDNFYSPQMVTVSPGTVVTWTNNGTMVHTVTAEDGSFDSGNINPGATFSHTFSAGGTFAYHCTLHGGTGGVGMSGTVTVPTPVAPTLTLSASPTTVTATQTFTLSWSSANATSCTASGGWTGSQVLSGSATFGANQTTTYTLACTGTGGTVTKSATVTVTGTSPAPTLNFTESPATVSQGQSSTLTWTSTNASTCTASGGWSGTQSTSGSVVATPQQTTTFTLACMGAGGSITQSVTLTVTPVAAQPTLTFTASPLSISAGQSTTLTWSSTNASSCMASGGWSGAQATQGSLAESPAVTTTYQIDCTGAGGTTSSTVTVTVTTSTPAAPTATLTAAPATVGIGQPTTLTWSSTNATSCVAGGGWAGAKAISGSATLNPAVSTTYTITCTGSGGSITASQLVTVTILPAPTDCTNGFSQAVAVPAGYGAAYNVFSTQHEALVSVSCTTATPKLTLGKGSQFQYIYKLAYAYQNNVWQPLNVTATTSIVASNWFVGQGTVDVPTTAAALANWNYVVGYVCTWNGTGWQCGCADTACTGTSGGLWQAQEFKK